MAVLAGVAAAGSGPHRSAASWPPKPSLAAISRLPLPDSPVLIGLNLRALAVYLVVFQHVPVERRRDLIGDVAGAVVSAGFICSCLGASTGLVADVSKTLMCEWSLSRWLARLLCRFGGSGYAWRP